MPCGDHTAYPPPCVWPYFSVSGNIATTGISTVSTPRTAFSSGLLGSTVLDVVLIASSIGHVVVGLLRHVPAVLEHLVEDLGRLELAGAARAGRCA